MPFPAAPSSDRVIRVFISSTFRDMQAERDHLVKFIFPQLRRRCEARGVTWGEVDLRWGVTDEEAAEGRVLPICLEEINRCRPYFIGLLGERYGWVPQTLPPELVEKETWLREQPAERKSVTELEILHGVLRNPAMVGHAFFYFRDPAYLATIPESDRGNFMSEDADSAEKLKRLKERILHSGRPVRENYPTPEALGTLVLTDLTGVIDRLFPEGSQPDPLAREALDHAAYARRHAQLYIDRAEQFARLDTYADGGSTLPLAVLGESGSGKSALLANWAARYRRAHPDVIVLEHYIGASGSSADWTAMVRRILGEFKKQLGLADKIPLRPEDLRRDFPAWLHRAAAAMSGPPGAERKREGWRAKLGFTRSRISTATAGPAPTPPKIVLILDALNQLDDRDAALDLLWLPRNVPENIRVIVSTLAGRSRDEIDRRRWPTLTVESFATSERRDLIHAFLAQHGRHLSPARVERIAAAPQSANPLFLTVLLDELRQQGEHERLGERIEHYLTAANPTQLFGLVLERLEQDYSASQQLVRESLSLLLAARRGLSEVELLDLLGRDRRPLPSAEWTPLFLALENNLVQRVGLLGIGHACLTGAARTRYFAPAAAEVKAHRQLADYFATERPAIAELASAAGARLASMSDCTQREFRRLDELPWQLVKASEWTRLAEFLTSPEWFEPLFLGGFEADLNQYWKTIGDRIDLGTAYDTAIDQLAASHPSPDVLGSFVHQVARFLARQSRFADAERHYRRALQLSPSDADAITALAIKSNLAETLVDLGRHQEAERLYREVWRANAGPGFDPVLRSIQLSNLANAVRQQDRLPEAIRLLEEAIALLDKHAATGPTLATNLINLAALFQQRGDFGAAANLCRRALQICESQLGSRHILTGRCLAGLGLACQQAKNNREAEPLYRRAIDIYEESGPENEGALLQTYHNLGWLLTLTGRAGEAIDLLKRITPALHRRGGASLPERDAIFQLLVALLVKSGRFEEVEGFAAGIFADSAGEPGDAVRLARDAMRLMEICEAHGQLAFADQICRQAVDAMEQIAGQGKAPQLIELLEALARICFALKDHEEAEDACWRVLQLKQRQFGADDSRYAEFRDQFARHYRLAGRPGDARRVVNYRLPS